MQQFSVEKHSGAPRDAIVALLFALSPPSRRTAPPSLLRRSTPPRRTDARPTTPLSPLADADVRAHTMRTRARTAHTPSSFVNTTVHTVLYAPYRLAAFASYRCRCRSASATATATATASASASTSTLLLFLLLLLLLICFAITPRRCFLLRARVSRQPEIRAYMASRRCVACDNLRFSFLGSCLDRYQWLLLDSLALRASS